MVGSRVRVPYYTPRLPMHSGGGVFQPAGGGTPYKPSPWGEAAKGLGGMAQAYMQGKEIKRKRGLEALAEQRTAELHPAQLGLLEARAEEARRSPQVHTPHYIAQVLGELQTGSPYSPLGIPMETLTDRQEHLDYAMTKFGPGWETSVPQALAIINKKFPTEGMTPLPLTGTQLAPEVLGGERLRKRVESRKVPTKVKPGLETLAREMPVRDEIDVISELMRRPFRGTGATGTWEEEPRKAKTSGQTFETYPAPKTEKEFDNTIKHIPSKKMKILYFETMVKKIKDEKLASRIYQKWGDELYK